MVSIEAPSRCFFVVCMGPVKPLLVKYSHFSAKPQKTNTLTQVGESFGRRMEGFTIRLVSSTTILFEQLGYE